METEINNLKRRGLDRVHAHGTEGFARVIALNIHRIGLPLRRRARNCSAFRVRLCANGGERLGIGISSLIFISKMTKFPNRIKYLQVFGQTSLNSILSKMSVDIPGTQRVMKTAALRRNRPIRCVALAYMINPPQAERPDAVLPGLSRALRGMLLLVHGNHRLRVLLSGTPGAIQSAPGRTGLNIRDGRGIKSVQVPVRVD